MIAKDVALFPHLYNYDMVVIWKNWFFSFLWKPQFGAIKLLSAFLSPIPTPCPWTQVSQNSSFMGDASIRSKGIGPVDYGGAVPEISVCSPEIGFGTLQPWRVVVGMGWRFLLLASKKLQTSSSSYLIVSFALLPLLAFMIQVHIIIEFSCLKTPIKRKGHLFL